MAEQGSSSGTEKKRERKKNRYSVPHVSSADGTKEGSGVNGLELVSSNVSPPVPEADDTSRLERASSKTPLLDAETDDTKREKMAPSNISLLPAKKLPNNLTDAIKPNAPRPTMTTSPTTSPSALRLPTAVNSHDPAGFGFFEGKPCPERSEADRPSGVHKRRSWQGKEGTLLGPDLIMIFGHGFLQNTALFIATLAEFVLLCHNLLMSIAIKEVDYWCKPPPKYSQMTANEWRNISTPRDADETWDPCFSYEPPLAVAAINRSRVPCQAWDYDLGVGRSVIAEWDLVCERHWLIPFQAVMYMSGAIAAAPIMGKLSDHIGRRPVICMSVLILLISGIAICFKRSYETFLVLRILVSASVSTIQITSFVLLFELSMPRQQCLHSVLSLAVALAAAPAFLWMVSRLVADWIIMQGLVMVPTSLLMCTFHVTTESPRWLVTKGKHKDVEEAIIWASRMNGTNIHKAEHQWCMLKDALHRRGVETSARSRSGVADIVGSPTLLRRSVIIFWCWFVIILAYYSHHLRPPSGSLWLLLAKLALQAPSFFLVYKSMMRLGRRATLYVVLIGLSFVSGLDVLLTSLELDRALLEVILRMYEVSLEMTVILIFTYSLELFPTVVRNFGLCTAYFFGRIGGMVAPLVIALSVTSWTEITPMLISVNTLIAALMVIYLPDASGILDTIKDLDNPNRKKTMITSNDRVACTSGLTRQ